MDLSGLGFLRELHGRCHDRWSNKYRLCEAGGWILVTDKDKEWEREMTLIARRFPSRLDRESVLELMSVSEITLAWEYLCVGLLADDKERYRSKLYLLGSAVGRDKAEVDADLARIPFAAV